MSTVSPAELARRARRHHVRIDAQLAARFLSEWAERGIVEEVLPGRWQLSAMGAARFTRWVQTPLDLDDEDIA